MTTLKLQRKTCACCGMETHAFERITKTSADTECPHCGAAAEKQVSVPAKAQFKGTGFYETDFKGKQ